MIQQFFEQLLAGEPFGHLWEAKVGPFSEQPVCEGYLYKSNQTTVGLELRYFILQENYLIYKKTKESSVQTCVLRLENTKLDFPNKEQASSLPGVHREYRLSIKLTKNGKFSILHARNEEEYLQWMTHLSRMAIRSDLHSRYKMDRVLGEGNFALVYRAHSQEGGSAKAIKGFSKSALLSKHLQDQLSLCNEIALLRKLDHPNLLRLHEVHETENSIYIVFDIHTGGELTKLMKESIAAPVCEETVVTILHGVAKGLKELDRLNIAHRDLKPSNIMLRNNTNITPEDVVIVDFGLATETSVENYLYKRCGTPGYIAPEIISTKNSEDDFKVTTKCDIFSLGVIGYTMIAGHNPFTNGCQSRDEAIQANLECKLSFPEDIFGKYSQELLALLKKLCSKRPEDRPNIDEVLSNPLFAEKSKSHRSGKEASPSGSTGYWDRPSALVLSEQRSVFGPKLGSFRITQKSLIPSLQSKQKLLARSPGAGGSAHPSLSNKMRFSLQTSTDSKDKTESSFTHIRLDSSSVASDQSPKRQFIISQNYQPSKFRAMRVAPVGRP